MIDYEKVLAIINASDDPADALQAFVEQEQEHAAHNATKALTAAEAAQALADTSWESTADRSARTAPARAAMDRKFLDEANGDPVQAEHLKKTHYRQMAAKSAQTRRQNKAVSS